MKNIVALTLAAAMSAASIGSVAIAQTTNATTPMMKDDMVTVVMIKEDSNSNAATKPVPEQFLKPTSEAMMKAQADAKADAKIMAALQKDNISIDKVVGIETAANGGKVVYAK